MPIPERAVALSAKEICFMSPTYRGDIDRFQLLRESITAYGQGHIRHYALIDTEDLPLLERLNLPNVVPVTTAQLLAPALEAGRIAYNRSGGRVVKRWQRSFNKRLGWFPNARCYGWQIQQLLKLAAPVALPERVFVSFDSDLIACGRFGLDDFMRDGKVALYESRFNLKKPKKPGGWHGNACRLLDLHDPVNVGEETADYVAQPFVFEKSHTQALQQWLEQRYQQPWWRSVLDLPLGGWSEFMIYGEFVRSHLDYAGAFQRPVRANSFWIQNRAQFENAEALIQQAFDDPDIHFLCLQADDHGVWTLNRFSKTVHACIENSLARGHGAAPPRLARSDPQRPGLKDPMEPLSALGVNRRFDLDRAGTTHGA